jgi:hypothetical protein
MSTLQTLHKKTRNGTQMTVRAHPFHQHALIFPFPISNFQVSNQTKLVQNQMPPQQHLPLTTNPFPTASPL